jgi:hypothetical protein
MQDKGYIFCFRALKTLTLFKFVLLGTGFGALVSSLTKLN